MNHTSSIKNQQVMNQEKSDLPAFQHMYKPLLNNHTVMIISRNPEKIKSVSTELYFEGFNCIKESSCAMVIDTLNVLNIGVALIDLDIPIEEAQELIEWLVCYRPSVHTFLLKASRQSYELFPAGTNADQPVSYSAVKLKNILKLMDRENRL